HRLPLCREGSWDSHTLGMAPWRRHTCLSAADLGWLGDEEGRILRTGLSQHLLDFEEAQQPRFGNHAAHRGILHHQETTNTGLSHFTERLGQRRLRRNGGRVTE